MTTETGFAEAETDRSPNLLLIEDDVPTAGRITRRLSAAGLDVSHASTWEEANRTLESSEFDCLIFDLRIPDGDVCPIQRQLCRHPNPPPLLFVTGDELTGNAILLLQRGSTGYVIERPEYLEQLADTIHGVLGADQHEIEPTRRRSKRAGQARSRSTPTQLLLGTSMAMRRVRNRIEVGARRDISVLITGETGTGKELAARAIHRWSDRADGPFIPVNCAAISSGLFESELFGSTRGAFTGADRDRKGLFGEASGGTIFLDEIGELPLDAQAKLLRVLEQGCYRRVGSAREIDANVRVVAATNRDLAEDSRQSRFRIDLFYRLDVLRIEMPALRDRLDDIPLLVDHFIELEFPAQDYEVEPGSLAQLKTHPWPGNVRELRHVVSRTMIWKPNRTIEEFDLRLREDPRQHDWNELATLLLEHHGRLPPIANSLGVSVRTLQRRIRDLGINVRDFRPPL